MRLPILLRSLASANVGAFPLTGEGGTRSVTDEGEKPPQKEGITMKSPRTRRMILAWVFLALGAAFTLIGLLSFVISIPTRNGDARDFLPLGVLLLIAGSILALSAHWYSRTAARLQAEGRSVPGTLLQIQKHPFIRFNQSFYRKSHPWSVRCSYNWEGVTYQIRSELLWREPAPDSQRPTVFLDPERPKRAFVDPESLQYKL